VKSIVRLPLIVVGTAAYLGLAVLGWGGLTAFFSHPALIALACALFAMSGVALFAGGNLSSGVREDRGNRWVLIAFGLIGLLDAFLPAWTDRKEFWTLDGDTIRWLGVVLFAAGVALRIWLVFVLGRRFSGLVASTTGLSPGAAPTPVILHDSNEYGHQGGRFYVNEHGAMFTPVGSGDGNGLDYIYCGNIERSAWFPEPPVME